MPTGKYTMADVAQPAAPMGKYTAADIDTTPAPPPPPPQQGLLKSFADSSGLSTVGNALLHPFKTADTIASAVAPLSGEDWAANPIVKGIQGQVDSTVGNLKQAGQFAKLGNYAGAVSKGISAIPVLGPTLDKATDQYADKNYAGEMGTLAGPVASLYGPKILGAAADTALKPLAKSAAIGDVTRMIRPSANDTSFAKSPAEGLLSQPGGIASLSKDSLLAKSKANLGNVGKQISDTVANAPQDPIDISQSVLKPFNSALTDAAKSNQTGLFGRLQEAKQGLTNDMFYDPNSESIQQGMGPKNLTAVTPSGLFDIKKGVGDNMRWTNQAFDDDLNATRGSIYGGLKDQLNAAVPEVKPLNEKYANLRSGVNALERRMPIEARNNAISLPDATLGAGAAAAGGVPYAAAGLAAKKLVNSTPFRTGVDAGLYKYGTNPMTPPTAAPSSLFYAPAQRKRQ